MLAMMRRKTVLDEILQQNISNSNFHYPHSLHLFHEEHEKNKKKQVKYIVYYFTVGLFLGKQKGCVWGGDGEWAICSTFS